MKVIFTPVPQADMPYNWWDGKSGITHPYMLISAGDESVGCKEKNRPKKPEGVKLFADSGGFQLHEEGVYLSPELVAQWQDDIGADFRFILDHPPVLRTHYGSARLQLHGEEFEKRLELTVDASKRMLNTYTSKCEVYGVIHGVTEAEIIAWRDSMMKVHDFDGWGMGSLANDTLNSNRNTIRLLSEVGVKKVHIFGRSGITNLLKTFKVLNEYNMEMVTFDSTSYIMTRFGNCYYPLLGETVDVFKRNEHHPDLRLVCDCPVCENLKPNAAYDAGEYVDFCYRVSIHNIQHTVQMTKLIEQALRYPDVYELLEQQYGVENKKEGVVRRLDQMEE